MRGKDLIEALLVSLIGHLCVKSLSLFGGWRSIERQRFPIFLDADKFLSGAWRITALLYLLRITPTVTAARGGLFHFVPHRISGMPPQSIGTSWLPRVIVLGEVAYSIADFICLTPDANRLTSHRN